ncbi:PfkB family carbohydrate kinase [Calycomorphotria hydatis]|nr:PfkB family carbohydrate kinase [Calycomorphotria hydatis]
MDTQPNQPAIFGEVLFDRFDDGRSVLGGAPFNVAWNLQGFGATPLFVSAVGQDELGETIGQTMAEWNMSLNGLQTHPSRPTGVVEVSVSDGEPSYEIVDHQAYDAIEADKLPQASNCPMLYHGSLALRHDQSLNALKSLKQQCDAPVYVDINIREPWFDPTMLDDLLRGASWVKLNEKELAGMMDLPCEKEVEIAAAATKFQEKYHCGGLWITRGGSGACCFDAHQELTTCSAPPVEKMVDTVGAGDAFASVTIYGLLNQWPKERILNAAVQFAARICGIRGATTTDSAFYQLTED